MSEVIAFDRQALQRPQRLFHTATMNPVSVDLARALSP
jgi:hypothetical protein